MDKNKMTQVARAMKSLQVAWNDKADEYAAQVAEGLLTADEAAKCLAGADLKARESLKADGFSPGPGHSLAVARQAIDSRLPGYNGLSVERHL